METVQVLINALVANPKDEDRALQLLRRLHDGADKRVVVRLIQNKASSVAELGAWVATELGAACEPVYSDVARYLDHTSWRVRFWVVDWVLTCAGEHEGRDLATVVAFLEDEAPADRRVRMAIRPRLAASPAWRKRPDG